MEDVTEYCIESYKTKIDYIWCVPVSQCGILLII